MAVTYLYGAVETLSFCAFSKILGHLPFVPVLTTLLRYKK